MIPDNDPVRLLNACVEGMDLSELYKTYTRVPKNLATPKQLFKIMAYAAMNGIYSSRKIETACRRDKKVQDGERVRKCLHCLQVQRLFRLSA